MNTVMCSVLRCFQWVAIDMINTCTCNGLIIDRVAFSVAGPRINPCGTHIGYYIGIHLLIPKIGSEH